ncbi:hypothetical protein BV87_03710 [Sphingobium yanoikuyae]|uniref:Transposase n=1 Tax=Sphingobium yanoikuyae TaxID=13690 RepID=A0A0J9FJB1_SPHYA|nr:hypothetical protein BV87_03710 [Sphingobium yanoikuyae]KMW28585.1 hypothetical protein BV87_19665 [Sphingobium yanoikuyae]
MQIAFALRQAEVGTLITEVCRKMGVSEATDYRWQQLYGWLGPSELREMRQLEEENQKLKQLVADLSLDKAMLQEFLAKKCSAWSPPGDRPLGARPLSSERAAQLRGPPVRSQDVPLSVDPRRPDAAQEQDQGDRGDPRALWLSPYPCTASARRLAGQREAGTSPLP